MKHSLLHSSFLLASLCVLLGSASPLLAYPMYVVYNDSTIGLYDSETGEVVNATFITGLNTPRFIACSGNILYVASEYGEKVSTYNATSGALINDNFITGLNRPAGIAVDGNDLLITIYGHNGNVGTTVQKHNAGTGALIDANFVTGLNSP